MSYTLAFKRTLCVFVFLFFLFNFKCACEVKWNKKKKNVFLTLNSSWKIKKKKCYQRKRRLYGERRKDYQRAKCKGDLNCARDVFTPAGYIQFLKGSLYTGQWRKGGNSHYPHGRRHTGCCFHSDGKEIQTKEEQKGKPDEPGKNTPFCNYPKEVEGREGRKKDEDRSSNETQRGKEEHPDRDVMYTQLVKQENVRNFCILAHIDSGKSTLADRFLELTNTIKKKKMKDQFLDMMSLEREKGITIKLKAVRMNYKNYIFNLIDTPGHFDFYHEVKRSVSVCEGAILLIDGCKGIQSQTLNIFVELKKEKLKIIPVINKIDMNTCIYEKIRDDLIERFNFKKNEILSISAKYGLQVENLFQKIITDIPFPSIKSNAFFRGIVFDSFYDQYKGVVLIIKVLNGFLKKKTEIFFINSEMSYAIQEVGYLIPELKQTEVIKQGDIAYICSNIRKCDDIQIGETIVNKDIVRRNANNEIVIDAKKMHTARMCIQEQKDYSTFSNSTNTCNPSWDDSYQTGGNNEGTYVQGKVKSGEYQGETHKRGTYKSMNHVRDKQQSDSEENKGKEYFERSLTEEVVKGENLENFEKIKEKNEINIKQIAARKVEVSYPSVYCNLYTVSDKKCNELEMALNKLKLNDSSFSFKMDICETLGKGFKCGFNGLLHLNIIQERIKREYNVETIVTAPSVNYLVKINEKYIDRRIKEKLINKHFDINSIVIDSKEECKDKKEKSHGQFFMTSNVNDIPQKNYIDSMYEPYVKTSIVTPEEYQKYIINECFKRRAIFISKEVVNDQIIFIFEMPLSEILINFLDEIKSCTKGYGSMSYDNYVIYKESDLYKINIYINKKRIDSLSFISHKLNYYEKAKCLVSKLKNLINPHQFLIVIQAAIGSKIFASEKIQPLKKNVTAKCYGGDITRRRKLIEKQNEGKKKMFTIGKVRLPPNIFTKLFNLKQT
ncbi:GTP-binding protein, putative [Plasmodium ovale wallikeri]|uniref:Translation factor GUF1 homolog, mitochondrial n=2 Tax=Plasmodium ovale TaxID=36330 RepID=A0A1A8YQR2_PLAOA|nr:GTP-binding protein, putative [Plasmodium ovale wallikeri]SBT33768.1 GTP-binding protein, putative [Plasmodium ovale wallikeri]SBT76313.1 GTP-binding protein, putative [Plasmodium ovale]